MPKAVSVYWTPLSISNENGPLVRAELVVERLQEKPRLLALAPLEVGEEHELPVGIRNSADPGVKVVGIHAQRNPVDRPLDSGRREALTVELGRHPDLVHPVGLADPVGGKAVDLEHREADLASPAIPIEDVALPVDHSHGRATRAVARRA